MKSHRLLVVALAVVAAFGANTASATTLRISFAEMAQSADLIFVGTVESQTCRMNEAGTMIFTDAVFTDVAIVNATERSRQKAASRITLTFAGGTVGDLSIRLGDTPRVETGRRYVLFALDDGAVYTSPLAGNAGGLFEVVRDRQSSEELVLTSDRKAVIGYDDADLAVSKESVMAVDSGKLVFAPIEGANKTSVPSPVATDGSPARARVAARSDASARPTTLRDFVERICPAALATPLAKRQLRTGDGGSLVKKVDGKVVRESLALRTKRAKASQSGANVDRRPKAPTPAPRGAISNDKTRGQDLGACGWQELPLVMEMYPDDWTEENGVANACILAWNKARDIFRTAPNDGTIAVNNLNEFGGYPTNEDLITYNGVAWNPAAIAVTTSRSRPNCGEILEADVFLNPAFSFALDLELSFENEDLKLLQPVLMHELGHVWGEQKGDEAYDYDVPSVMHAYVSDTLIEDGMGIHAPDARLMRVIYGIDTAAVDVGVEFYFADDGLNAAETDAGFYNAGEPIKINGMTVENISWHEVSDVNIRFFLSTDRRLSANDVQLGPGWFWTTFPGMSYWDGDFETTVPTVIASGDYFVLAAVTVNGLENDGYVFNNVTSLPLPITIEGSIVPTVNRIAASTRADRPWKLKVFGSDMRQGMRVFIGDDGFEWTNTRLKFNGLFVLKGGDALLRFFPAGEDVPIRLVNPDGGETVVTFTR